MYHPLSKEKSILKDLGREIRESKDNLRDSGMPYFRKEDRWPEYHKLVALSADLQPRIQRRLAALKRSYRNRHIAYCIVRRGDVAFLYGTGRDIESLNTLRDFDQKEVDEHRLRLLGSIARYYSLYCNSLLADIETYKPCIAIFVSKYGKEKKLVIEDFERRPNGDFVWIATGSGIVRNDLMEWTVREDDKLPPEMKLKYFDK
jgi:hypothetical protein